MTFTTTIQEALRQHPPHISTPSTGLSYLKCETDECRHELAVGILVTDLLNNKEPHEWTRPHE